MDAEFDVENCWPELFAELDETQRRAVVQSLVDNWDEGWVPNREDVECLTDAARGAVGVEDCRRRVHAAAERQRTTSRRVFFRDVKPYEVPERLDDLKGPIGGVVCLPHSVLWAPGGGHVDLDAEGGVGLAYRAVLSEGTVAEQVAVVNRDRLMEVWQGLLLPRRVRELWEARFPELRGSVSA